MKPTYRIKDWNEHYEVAQTRKVNGGLNWVAIPTKHDGKGYRRLMRRADGPAVFAAWVLIVQVAAKCPDRGVLADSDGPLDADDLSDKTDCPAEVFRNALNVLADKSIGWLERSGVVAEREGSGSTVSHKQTGQTNKQTTTTTSSSTTAQQGQSDLGAAVDAELYAYGVRRLDLIGQLQCSPDLALKAIRFAASKQVGGVKAWPPAFLVNRLKNLRDGQDPEDESMFGDVDVKYAQAVAAEKGKGQQAAERKRQDDEKAAERKRLADLEDAYGATLDGMSDVDRDALAVGLPTFIAKVYRQKGWKSVRTGLLELLRQRDGPPGSRPPTLKDYHEGVPT